MSDEDAREYWAQQVAEHAIWDQSETLAQSLRDLAPLDEELADPEDTRRLIQRGLRLVDEIRARLRGADPELVPQGVLNNALNAVNSANGHAENIKQQPENRQYLNQLRSSIETLAQHTMTLPPSPSDEEAEVITKAVRRVRATMLEAVSTGHEGAKAAEERFEELQTAHSEELRQREERIASANERIAELEAQVKDAVELVNTQQATVESQITDGADRILRNIRDLRQQATELVTAAAADVIGGGYADVAEKQKEAADNWRIAAVVFGVLAGLVAVVSLFVVDAATTDQTIRTTTVTLALFAIAGYSGRQSGAHRRREEFATKASLELATLEPYLATLPLETRETVRATYAMNFFTQPLIPPKNGEDRLSNIERLAEMASTVRARESESGD